MHVVKNLPLIFLMLLAGCTDQLPDTTRVAGPVPDPIVETVGSKNTDARKTVWQSGVSERIESRYRPNVVEAIGPQASQSVSVSTERTFTAE